MPHPVEDMSLYEEIVPGVFRSSYNPRHRVKEKSSRYEFSEPCQGDHQQKRHDLP